MTPLAHRYFRQLALPLRERGKDPDGLLRSYEDLHCFDVCAIYEAATAYHGETDTRVLLNQLPGPYFLPAPATWLEFDTETADRPGRHRTAYLLTEINDGPRPGVQVSGIAPGLRAAVLSHTFWPYGPLPGWDLQAPGDWGSTHPWTGFSRGRAVTDAMFLLHIINTPGLVKLATHAPHRGLDRRLQAMGHYPLMAWHEVTVDPAAIKEVGDGHGGLSGRKCLHFVRAHRRRLGPAAETIVRAHWRGDPSIGLQRTRYRVGP